MAKIERRHVKHPRVLKRRGARRGPPYKDAGSDVPRAHRLLAANIRDLLAERGIYQKELAERVGKSQPYFSQVLTGRRGLTLAMLDKVSAELNTSVSDLFRDPAVTPRSVSPDEAAFLDGLRQADPRTIDGIRDILHVPPAMPDNNTEHALIAHDPNRERPDIPDDDWSLIADIAEAFRTVVATRHPALSKDARARSGLRPTAEQNPRAKP